MSKMTIKVHESAKVEAVAMSPKEFWESLIQPKAHDLLEAYEMNDTQGVPGTGEGWEGDYIEDIPNIYLSDGSPRDDFNAGMQKTFFADLFYFYSTGYGRSDKAIDKAVDAYEDQAVAAYEKEHGKVPDREDADYEDLLDMIDSYLQEVHLWGIASIEMKSRSLRGINYTLSATIDRSIDGGEAIDEGLEVEMNLTLDQLTEANARKFLTVVEHKLMSYSFSDGDESLKVNAQ